MMTNDMDAKLARMERIRTLVFWGSMGVNVASFFVDVARFAYTHVWSYGYMLSPLIMFALTLGETVARRHGVRYDVKMAELVAKRDFAVEMLRKLQAADPLMVVHEATHARPN